MAAAWHETYANVKMLDDCRAPSVALPVVCLTARILVSRLQSRRLQACQRWGLRMQQGFSVQEAARKPARVRACCCFEQRRFQSASKAERLAGHVWIWLLTVCPPGTKAVSWTWRAAASATPPILAFGDPPQAVSLQVGTVSADEGCSPLSAPCLPRREAERAGRPRKQMVHLPYTSVCYLAGAAMHAPCLVPCTSMYREGLLYLAVQWLPSTTLRPVSALRDRGRRFTAVRSTVEVCNLYRCLRAGTPGSGGYGAHPAMQEHGIAEAAHKEEGLLSKTVGLLKV